MSATIYDYKVKDADGKEVSLEKYKGKVVLIINVASQCGFTNSNYTQLKEILDKYHEQGFEVAAFPCNQFGGQVSVVFIKQREKIQKQQSHFYVTWYFVSKSYSFVFLGTRV